MAVVLKGNGSSLDGSDQCNATLYQLATDITNTYPPLVPWYMFLSVTGILSSFVNLLVLTRPSMKTSSMYIHLVALEISNFYIATWEFIVLVLLHVSPELLVRCSYVIHLSADILYTTAINFISWITVVIAAWRCVVVTRVQNANLLLSKTRALVVVICLGIFCGLGAVLIGAFAYPIQQFTFTVCIEPRKVVKMDIYDYSANTVTTPIVFTGDLIFFVFPCLSAVILNGILLSTLCLIPHRQRELREGLHGTERRHTRTTVIIFCIVSGFVFCNVSISGVDIWELFRPETDDFLLLRNLFGNYNLVLFVNSFSFVAYYFICAEFRGTFHRVFKLRVCSRCCSEGSEVC